MQLDWVAALAGYWPIWLAVTSLFVGCVIGWQLSVRSLLKDAKDGHAAYLGNTAYRLIPVDLEHEYETEQRRQFGTMAEQSW